MLEPPGLQAEAIIDSLRVGYGLQVSTLEFLPLGNDSSAWAYRITTTDSRAYFLKVKKGAIETPGILIPRFLSDQGLRQAVAAYPTRTGALWQPVDDYGFLVYPFIEGVDGMTQGLTEGQWIEYGAILKQLHSTKLPAELLALFSKETFIPRWSPIVRQISDLVSRGDFTEQSQRELAAFWRGRSSDIAQLVARAEALGRSLQTAELEFVVCHADIHTANLLLTADDRMFVVDWDGLLLAPRERDLMFVVGNAIGGDPVSKGQTALFFEGYGPADIHRPALAYYRYEWVVQDLGDYGERVFLAPEFGEEIRQDAVRGLLEMFEPGNVVEIAYGSE